MFRSLRMLSLLAVMVMLFSTAISSVFACTQPPESMRLTLEEKLQRVDLVFTGTVVGEEGQPPYGTTYIIQVDEYLKGSGPGMISIVGFSNLDRLEWSCGQNTAQVGMSGLFFADGDATTGETLRASYEWSSDAIQSRTAENIEAVVNIVGQEPVTPDVTAITTLAKYLPALPVVQVILLVFVPLIVTGTGALVMYYLRREKRKRKNSG
jgi:hypothetical protein